MNNVEMSEIRANSGLEECVGGSAVGGEEMERRVGGTP